MEKKACLSDGGWQQIAFLYCDITLTYADLILEIVLDKDKASGDFPSMRKLRSNGDSACHRSHGSTLMNEEQDTYLLAPSLILLLPHSASFSL